MDQQQDLRLFIEQLETVAAHCDDTNMRAGAATIREAIERLSAAPTPDVACVLGEPMMHGPQPYRWCATHNRLFLACEREGLSLTPDAAGLVEEARELHPFLRSFKLHYNDDETSLCERDHRDILLRLANALESLSRERAQPITLEQAIARLKDFDSVPILQSGIQALDLYINDLRQEREVLEEGFKAAIRMSDHVQEAVFGECRPEWTDIAINSPVITYAAQDKLDLEAIRKALALIEGKEQGCGSN